MKIHASTIVLCVIMAMASTSCRTSRHPLSLARDAFGGLYGSLVLLDCSSGRVTTYRSDAANTRLPPCSTFKIVNSLIGIEEGLVTAPQQLFYQWDGVARSLPAWNQDLSFRESFQASCVPAFQNLARQIGAERMQDWLNRIGYGNRDINAGIDVFWLPAKGRTCVFACVAQGKNVISRQDFAIVESVFQKEGLL